MPEKHHTGSQRRQLTSSAIVDSLTDHGLTVLIGKRQPRGCSTGSHRPCSWRQRSASLVEALVIDRAGIQVRATFVILLAASEPASEAAEEAVEKAVLVEEEPPQAVRAATATAAPATARKLRREIIIRKLSAAYIKNCTSQRECAHLHY